MPSPEVPVMAAVRCWRTQKVIGAARHHECLELARAEKLEKRNLEQGFLTNEGRFVNRRVAFCLMRLACRKSADPDGYRGNELFSEDLY